MTISFNGNYGDCIYHPDFFGFIKYFKSRNANVIIHTNGSYKTKVWWQELASLLNDNDLINFSIDGTPENFTQYRINADWESIKQGIEVMVSSSAKVIWKYIVFSYNENSINIARSLSQELAMDDFVLNNSDRWEENDWLKPIKYVNVNDDTGTGVLYNGSHIGGRDAAINKWKLENMRKLDINPLCKKTNNMHFVSADGYYMPCCWIGDHRFYYQSDFYKNKEQYDISKTSVSKLFANQSLVNFYNTIEEIKPKHCTFNCSKL
jgi:hypothetical protein